MSWLGTLVHLCGLVGGEAAPPPPPAALRRCSPSTAAVAVSQHWRHGPDSLCGCCGARSDCGEGQVLGRSASIARRYRTVVPHPARAPTLPPTDPHEASNPCATALGWRWEESRVRHALGTWPYLVQALAVAPCSAFPARSGGCCERCLLDVSIDDVPCAGCASGAGLASRSRVEGVPPPMPGEAQCEMRRRPW